MASRIHRMRRRKHRFPLGTDKSLSNNGQQSGSSDGPDPSSSDFSADTVIYMGPCNAEETDGEHPPVYLPSLSSEDNRCAMNKVLKGSIAEKQINKTPTKKLNTSKRDSSSSPVSTLQRIAKPASTNEPAISSHFHGSPLKVPQSTMSPQHTNPQKILSHKSISNVENKSSNVPSPKGSPMKRPTLIATGSESPKLRQSEEKWVDGPRVSRAKVAEARHLLREKNHVKQCETWIDGPNTNTGQKSLTTNTIQTNLITVGGGGYGFMDSHKKTMIRQWVENQTTQILSSSSQSTNQSPQHQRILNHQLMELKSSRSENDKSMIPTKTNKILQNSANNSESQIPRCTVIQQSVRPTDCESEKSENQSSLRSNGEIKVDLNDQINDEIVDDEDEDSGPSEVPPALPLIDSLSREISHESINLLCARHRDSISVHSASVHSASIHSTSVQMMDCGLQVTEEEIARTMGGLNYHPLSALSNAEISVVSSFNIGDAFSECGVGDRTRSVALVFSKKSKHTFLIVTNYYN